MKVLELEPLKKKKLELVLVETEFAVQWSITNHKETLDDWNLRIMSDAYVKAIDSLVDKHKPVFAVEELGARTMDEFLYDNKLVDVFKKRAINHGAVDIDENAVGYLATSLDPMMSMHEALIAEAKKIKDAKDISKKSLYHDIMMRAEYLKAEVDSNVETIRTRIREAWMVMGILERAQAVDKPKFTAMLVCDGIHFDGIDGFASQLGIDTVKITMQKKVKEMPESKEVFDFLKGTVLDVAPVKIKQKTEAERILYMFDTDAFASPFDINMAYDAGFSVVMPFASVTADKVTRLVQDAMFSRKPNAPTCFFVGGSDVREANKIADKVVKALVPGFEHPVVVDPRGSHTTASAVVAKTLDMALKHGAEDLSGKKVAIFGAGPVGQIAAIIAAKEHCSVTLVETWDKASEQSIVDLVTTLNAEAGQDSTPIKAAFAPGEDSRYDVAKDADVLWAVAVAGVQVLPKSIMSRLPGDKLAIDINAVPPAGIDGLKAKHENTEIYPGIFGTGSLALGGLKYVTESNMLKEAAQTSGAKIFNYDVAYETAKNILFGKKIIVAQK